jgi:hypothetical protein
MIVTTTTKARHFEDADIRTDDGEVLRAKLAMPKPPMSPQRVVLISPLVGAGAGQPLLTFRNFARRGAIVISFEYRGHPLSTGTFELDKTVVDTHYALLWAAEYARNRGLPLHGFATCYGAIPLLAQFRRGGVGHLFRSINTISGLYNLNQILRIEDFAPILSRRLGCDLDAPAMLAGIADGTLDCHAPPFREALRDYLAGLMPELRVGTDGFEELQYKRVNLRQTLLQFSQARYLDGVHVPPWVPCTACVGQQDHLFLAQTAEGRKIYKRHVRSVVPHAMLFEFDMDHFGRGPGHDPVIDCVADAFERYDTSHVPPPHAFEISQQALQPRILPR